MNISRRNFLQTVGAAGAVAVAGNTASAHENSAHGKILAPQGGDTWDPGRLGTPMMRDPIWVYDNWAAYTDGLADGLARLDHIRLTEELAMRELDAIVRLKRLGVHFDYYMMNAFWFAPDGAYREWRKPDWPNGPDHWIAACKANGLKPGLWFGSNTLFKYEDGWRLKAAPQWQDSLVDKSELPSWQAGALSFFEGGFLADYMAAMQYWYDRGIRMFEMDFAYFDMATASGRKKFTQEEIIERNKAAFREALHAFRKRNPDAMLVAFNDFGGDIESTATGFPFKKPVDLRWLEVFDTLYSGDTRISDVPMVNFWRSLDLFNDHMTRRYEQSGVPLERSDPFFTMSTTWFGYDRQTQAWKGMLLLTAARGSWKKTLYGSLGLLTDDDASWFAKVQRLYAPLMAMGRTKSFGGIPGEVEPYGFASIDQTGALYTVVNPTQQIQTITLPVLSRIQTPPRGGRLLFRDAGYVPQLEDDQITLGPGQMAVAGFGSYAAQECDLGIQSDVVIPKKIQPIEAVFRDAGKNAIDATIAAPARGDLRILFQQHDSDGAVVKSPDWEDLADLTSDERRKVYLMPMDQFFKIEAFQDGKALTVVRQQKDKDIVFGISWGAGEISNGSFIAPKPITIRCSSIERKPVKLRGYLYAVEY